MDLTLESITQALEENSHIEKIVHKKNIIIIPDKSGKKTYCEIRSLNKDEFYIYKEINSYDIHKRLVAVLVDIDIIKVFMEASVIVFYVKDKKRFIKVTMAKALEVGFIHRDEKTHKEMLFLPIDIFKVYKHGS